MGLEAGTHGTSVSRLLHKAHLHQDRGFLSGEVKVALALRMLTGGSYLDLSLIFNTHTSQPTAILHYVCKNWFNIDSIAKFCPKTYLSSHEQMTEAAHVFKQKSRGLFTGCIGALDGWLVRIKRPMKKDQIAEPGDFFLGKDSSPSMFRSWLIDTREFFIVP